MGHSHLEGLGRSVWPVLGLPIQQVWARGSALPTCPRVVLGTPGPVTKLNFSLAHQRRLRGRRDYFWTAEHSSAVRLCCEFWDAVLSTLRILISLGLKLFPGAVAP